MRLLIIGSGAIGAALAKAIDDMPEVASFYITDKNEERAMKSVKGFSKAKFISSTDESVRAHLKNVDLVVEAASQDAVKHYVPLILGHGNDVLVMSVGAFADDEFREKCFGLAKRKGGRLYVPSGAVCGTDALHAASADRIDSVELHSTKGPKSFKDVPYLKEKGIDVDKLTEKTIIYPGTGPRGGGPFPQERQRFRHDRTARVGPGQDHGHAHLRPHVRLQLAPPDRQGRLRGDRRRDRQRAVPVQSCHFIPRRTVGHRRHQAHCGQRLDRGLKIYPSGPARAGHHSGEAEGFAMTERGKRIFSKLREEIDAIVLVNGDEPNLDMAFSYAAGTEAGLFEGCVTVIDPDGKVQDAVKPLEETSARRSKAEVMVFQGSRGRSCSMMKDSFGHARRIGINGHGLTYSNLMDIKRAAPKAEIVDVSYAIAASRLVKDQDEVERLRKACQIASQVGDELPSIVKEGMPEYEAAAEVGYRMMKLGASTTSFTTNASFGPEQRRTAPRAGRPEAEERGHGAL